MRNCSLISNYRRPPAIKKTKTPEQVKAEFEAKGITISKWARDRGYTPRQVSLVLNGQVKGRYGMSHEIAVKLGLKPADQAAA